MPLLIGLPPVATMSIGCVSVAVRPLADALIVIVSTPLADVPTVLVPLVPVPDTPVELVPVPDVPVVLVPDVTVELVPVPDVPVVLVPELTVELVARMTTEELPAVVGVPEMAPVAALILKPAGRPVAA